MAKRTPKLTDAERHARFKDMAREVEASEKPTDFDKAFKSVATPASAASVSGKDRAGGDRK